MTPWVSPSPAFSPHSKLGSWLQAPSPYTEEAPGAQRGGVTCQHVSEPAFPNFSFPDLAGHLSGVDLPTQAERDLTGLQDSLLRWTLKPLQSEALRAPCRCLVAMWRS